MTASHISIAYCVFKNKTHKKQYTSYNLCVTGNCRTANLALLKLSHSLYFNLWCLNLSILNNDHRKYTFVYQNSNINSNWKLLLCFVFRFSLYRAFSHSFKCLTLCGSDWNIIILFNQEFLWEGMYRIYSQKHSCKVIYILSKNIYILGFIVFRV